MSCGREFLARTKNPKERKESFGGDEYVYYLNCADGIIGIYV